MTNVSGLRFCGARQHFAFRTKLVGIFRFVQSTPGMAAVSQKKFRRLSRFLPSAAVPNFVSNVHFKEFGMRVFIFLLLLGLLTFGNANVITPTYSPHIPRVWDDAEMAKLQLPLVVPTASPKQVTADYYYRIPVRTIYKNYPVYVPGKEPAGYLEWLKQQEPQSAFEPSTFKTEATGSAQANSCSTRQFFTTTS